MSFHVNFLLLKLRSSDYREHSSGVNKIVFEKGNFRNGKKCKCSEHESEKCPFIRKKCAEKKKKNAVKCI